MAPSHSSSATKISPKSALLSCNREAGSTMPRAAVARERSVRGADETGPLVDRHLSWTRS